MASTAALNLNMHGTGNLRDHMMGVTRNLSLNNDTTRHHHPHHHPHLTATAGIGPLPPNTSTAEDSPLSTTDMEEDVDPGSAPLANSTANYGSDSEDAEIEPQKAFNLPRWSQSDSRHYQPTVEDFMSTAGGDDEAGASNNQWMQSPGGHRDHRTDSSADEDLSSKSKKRRKQSKPVRITNDEETPNGKSRSLMPGNDPGVCRSLLFANPLTSAIVSTPKLQDRDRNSLVSPYDNHPSPPGNTGRSSSMLCPHCDTTVPVTDFEQHLLEKHAPQFNLPMYGSATEDPRLLAQHLAYSSLFQQSGNLINSMKDPFGYPYSFSLASLMKDGKSPRVAESESSASLSGSPASSPNRHSQQHPNNLANKSSLEEGEQASPAQNNIEAEAPEASGGDGDNEEAYSHPQHPEHLNKLLPAMPNLLSFPAHNPFLFPFLNPNFPPSLTPVSSSSSLHPGPPLRIFNPEAYCELCNKEFCNKYFLKTHKANKHGIYTDPPATPSSSGSNLPPSFTPTSSRPANSSSPPMSLTTTHVSGGTLLSTPNLHTSGLGRTANGAAGPASGNTLPIHAALSGMAGLPQTGPSISSSLTSSDARTPPPSITSTPKSEMFPFWSASVLASAATVPHNPNLTPSLSKLPGINNPEAFCELCQKEFCNKYFLKRHKAKIHGIQPDPATPGQSQGTKRKAPSLSASETSRIEESLLRSPLFNDLSRSSAHFDPSSNACLESNSPVKDSKPHPSALLAIPAAIAAAAVPGKLCSASKSDGLLKESQKDSASANPGDSFSVEGNILPSSIDHFMASDNGEVKSEPSLEPLKPGDPLKDNLSLLKIPTPNLSHFSLANTANTIIPSNPTSPNASLPSNNPPESAKKANFSPEKLRQMGVINAEAFCEICCKEFCNKYFLRTHKYKKHGIGTPESAGLERSPSKNGHSHGGGSGCSSSTAGETLQSTPLNLTRLKEEQQAPLSKMAMEAELSTIAHQLCDSLTDDDSKSTSNSVQLECDICQRPFQSSYLLRMHRMYFHNTNTPEPTTEGQPSNAEVPPQAKSTTSDDNDKQLSETENVTEKDLPNAEISEDLQKLQSMIMELNNATNGDTGKVQCKVCRRNIDKMYIATHMLTDHGIFAMDEPLETSMAAAALLEVKKDNPAKDLSLLGENSLGALQASGNQPTYCQLCKKDFYAFYFLQLHLQNYHGLPATNTTTASSGSVSPKSFLDRVKAEIDGKKTPGNAAGADLLQRRPSATPTRSYCEICNKELCNKYFMKTHMLKMHGINLESGAQLGGVTCDICHKELCSKYFLKVHKQNTHGIYEDQTNAIDLTTSYGLNPFVAQDDRKSETKTELCTLCQRRFKSGKWLKGHLTTEHGERGKEEWRKLMLEHHRNKRQQQSQPSQPPQSSGSLPANASAHLNGPQVCRTCGQTFPEMVSLQVHIIKNHPECEDSPMRALAVSPGALHLSSNNGATEEINNASNQNPLENSSKTYYCSFCPFSTPSLPYLFAHERTHNKNSESASTPSPSLSQSRAENLSENWPTFKDKSNALQCPVCLQHVPVDIFQQHVVTHQFPQLLQNLLPFQALMAGGDPSKYLAHAQIPGTDTLLAGMGNNMTASSKKKKSKTFCCNKCSKTFKSRQNCLEHILTQHRPRVRKPGVTVRVSLTNPSRSNPLQCKHCGFTSRFWSILRSHIRRQHYNKQMRSKNSPSSPPLMPTSYAVPQSSNHFIMQAFLLAQPSSATPGPDHQEISVNVPLAERSGSPTALSDSHNTSGGVADSSANESREQNFVPSLVYLPVSRKISTPMSVTFNLTPA